MTDVLKMAMRALGEKMPEDLSPEDHATWTARRNYIKRATFAIRCENTINTIYNRKQLEDKISLWMRTREN